MNTTLHLTRSLKAIALLAIVALAGLLLGDMHTVQQLQHTPPLLLSQASMLLPALG